MDLTHDLHSHNVCQYLYTNERILISSDFCDSRDCTIYRVLSGPDGRHFNHACTPDIYIYRYWSRYIEIEIVRSMSRRFDRIMWSQHCT
jgi:hypothetical protein